MVTAFVFVVVSKNCLRKFKLVLLSLSRSLSLSCCRFASNLLQIRLEMLAINMDGNRFNNNWCIIYSYCRSVEHIIVHTIVGTNNCIYRLYFGKIIYFEGE